MQHSIWFGRRCFSFWCLCCRMLLSNLFFLLQRLWRRLLLLFVLTTGLTFFLFERFPLAVMKLHSTVWWKYDKITFTEHRTQEPTIAFYSAAESSTQEQSWELPTNHALSFPVSTHEHELLSLIRLWNIKWCPAITDISVTCCLIPAASSGSY